MAKTENVTQTQHEQPKNIRVPVSENSPFVGLGDFGYAAAPGLAPKPLKKIKWTRKLFITIGLGLLSGVLYVLLYKYQGDLTHLAVLTRQGHKIDFIIPIIAALVFSLVHGSFTSHFWSALGIKAKHKTN